MDHQDPVELGLQLHVRESRPLYLCFHIRMADTVQREVAEKAVQIGKPRLPVQMEGKPVRCRTEKGFGRFRVHPVAHLFDGGGAERMMIEENVRPVQADEKGLRPGEDRPLPGRIQEGTDLTAEAVVRVSGRHVVLLLYHFNLHYYGTFPSGKKEADGKGTVKSGKM